MKTLNDLKLIDGVFSPDNAKKVLYNVIDSKIQFHDLLNFSSEVTNGIKDNNSLKRSEELKEIKDAITELISYAESKGKKLEINSYINITVVD